MKIKLYRKILLIELSILATLALHYFVTISRGYRAIGGEFLVVPLLVILYQFYLAIKARWEEAEEYFKKKAIQE